MVAFRFGISFLVFNSTSHSFAVLTHELSSQTLEEKFHIYARPCIILYLKLLLGKFMVVNQFELYLDTENTFKNPTIPFTLVIDASTSNRLLSLQN